MELLGRARCCLLLMFLWFALSLGGTLRLSGQEASIVFPSRSSDATVKATCGDGEPTSTVLLINAEVASLRLGNVAPSCAGVADLRTPCVAESAGMPALWYCAFVHNATSEELVEGPFSARRSLDRVDGEALAVATYLDCPRAPSKIQTGQDGWYNVEARYWLPHAASFVWRGVPDGNLVYIGLAPPPISPPTSPPPSPPAAPPPVALVIWTENGGGSGTDAWTPATGYSCAVVDHVFTSDFDVVIAVHGHSYIGMGMGYGSGVSADTNLHVGHTGGNCYGSNIGQWTSSFGLTYTGGYHCARALCRTCAEPCLCAHVPSRD